MDKQFIALRAYAFNDKPIEFEYLGIVMAKDYEEAITSRIFT